MHAEFTERFGCRLSALISLLLDSSEPLRGCFLLFTVNLSQVVFFLIVLTPIVRVIIVILATDTGEYKYGKKEEHIV